MKERNKNSAEGAIICHINIFLKPNFPYRPNSLDSSRTQKSSLSENIQNL